MIMSPVLEVVIHTVCWALLATAFVLIPAIPLAYGLARYEFPGKRAVSALVTLPMVLPPTAVGYLLLYVLADAGVLGRDTLGFDLDIILTWKGVIVAYAVMSLPLVVRAARVSFEEVDPRLETMSRTLGYSACKTFFVITLPLASKGLAAATILGFTRAMGEFGATIMVAGNIPGRTQTLASAIYSAQQSGNFPRANLLLGIALVIGFTAVFLMEWLLGPRRREPVKRA